MSFLWSVVSSYPAEKPVEIPSAIKGSRISHSELISNNIPETNSSYWYYNKYLLGNGYLQTALSGGDYEREYPIWYGRRYMVQPDGAQFSVDYAIDFQRQPPSGWGEDVKYLADPETPRLPKRTRVFRPEEVRVLDNPESTKPLFIHLHGLTGGSHENYLRSVILETERNAPGAFESVVITSRGCNRSKITTPQLFNGIWTDDLRFFINHVRAKQPNRPIFLAGYSLGGCILANYLGQEGRNVAKAIKAAIVVSAPWDLLQCHHTINSTYIGRKVFSPRMAENLMRLIRNNKPVMDQSETFREQYAKVKLPLKVVAEFDDLFTGPLFGFSSAMEYYRKASPTLLIDQISVPTLIVASKDDPVCGDIGVPYVEASKNPFTHTVTTSYGGHLGWFQQDGKRWHSGVLAKYVKAFLDHTDLKESVELPPAKTPWFRDHRFQSKPVSML